MSPYNGLANTNAQLDAHEDRIQRLEENVGDIRTDVAEIKVRLEVVSEMDVKLDRILESMGAQEERLASLEGTRRGTFKVMAWVGGLAGAIVTAAVLAFLGLN